MSQVKYKHLEGIDFLAHARRTPSLKEVEGIKESCGMTINEIAEIIKVKPRTVYGWLLPVSSTAHRTPSMTTWRQLMYELFARQQGYENLDSFLSSTTDNKFIKK